MGSVDSVNSSIITERKYMDLVQDSGLSWILTDHVTRRRVVNDSVQESLLDQIFCTDDLLIDEYEIGQPLGKSDHVSIVFEVKVCNPTTNTAEDLKKRNWSKITDLNLLKSSSNIDWSYSNDYSLMNVEDMWQELNDKLLLMTEDVPFHVDPLKNSMNKSKMPWLNSSMKRSFKAKNKAWALFDEEPCRVNLNLALERQRIFEAAEVKAKVDFEKKLTNDLKNNSKGFYKYLRNSRKVKSVVTNLEKADGSFTESDAETAECFSEAFSSVFVSEPYGPLPEKCFSSASEDIDDLPDTVSITEDDVCLQLEKLNIYKSMGPDNIHPKLLKSLAGSRAFVRSLTLLYNKCAEECKIPSIWKTANVVALHKKGSKKQALNYRPVSLTCILCKIYEQFVRTHILNIVEDKIVSNQHGFVDKKSCFSNLLETVDTIMNIIEDGSPVDVFYFDFCKAFDSVPHYRLITKLENYGVTGPMLNIVKDFLSDRTMRTMVRGSYSKHYNVVSGVPQGSVLGPSLFVLFINDLPNGLNNETMLFADDLKLICCADDISGIKEDLKNLQEWEDIWLLKFNPTKCKVMHLDINCNSKESFMLDGVVLEEVNSETDLGVCVSSDLNWRENIYSCIKEANRMIAWITRTVINKSKYVMLNIYKTLIRPKLEYCVQLWSPRACHGNWSIILDLESVQRRFTRMINEIGTLSYSKRLGELKLTTLAERRLRGDLIETFKIVNGLVDYGQYVFRLSRSGSNIISKSLNDGDVDSGVKKLRYQFIAERVKPFWNNLPIHVKNSSNVDMFKANLESFKKGCISINENNFWDVSRILLEKIEGPSYLQNKEKQNDYLVKHPYVAKKLNINIVSVEKKG